jgi:hypothetical protein
MERSTEIEDAFRLFCELRSAAEASRFDDIYSSQFKLFIGPAPEDWYSDVDFMRKAFGSPGLTVTPNNPEGYTQGDTGWVSDRPTFAIADGPSATLRTTVVMRKEDGRWKVVHLHNSAGVPIEEIFS